MKDVFKHITANGKEYPFVFNINIVQAIAQKYGRRNGIKAWAELVQPSDGSDPDIDALIFMCKECINEGIDMENEEKQEKRLFVNEKQAGRIISAMDSFLDIAVETIKESNDTGKEKNLMTGQNQTITE